MVLTAVAWYVAGPLIGLFVPALLLLGNKQLGISSNLRHLCAALVPRSAPFFQYGWKEAGLWNLAFLVGIMLGGFIGGQLLAGPAVAIAARTHADLAASCEHAVGYALGAPPPRNEDRPGMLAVYGGLGVLFGLVLTKSEAVSWFRIQEVFRFQSFHMYGILGSAVVVAGVSIALIKRYQMKTLGGEAVTIPPKALERGYRYWIGGSLFGIGWAFTGASPARCSRWWEAG